ncbi:MAG: efflux RND transporter periplasmic adaptor subunit, partial [Desulfovibrio sp.]|nr:efflux RND transporter periplasmic adaptor subunit [Desulfovibrio sp.]
SVPVGVLPGRQTPFRACTGLLVSRAEQPCRAHPRRPAGRAGGAGAREALPRLETLLWLARSPGAEPAEEQADLETLVRGAAGEAQRQFADRHLDCEIATQPCTLPLRTEAARIVVGNIVRNAFQHTLRGSVHIRQRGALLVVENVMAQDVPAERRTGFGLGLELTRRLAARCGWELETALQGMRGTAAVNFAPEPAPPADGGEHRQEGAARLASCRGFCLALILPLCLAGCGGDADGEAGVEEPPLVRYATASAERIALACRLPGRVAAMETSEVRPQVDGIIQQRLFKEGAMVEQGQVLYQIDDARYRAACRLASAELAEAQAAATALAQQERRRRSLAQENAVSRQALDDAISEHGQAKARIAKAKASLEMASINLAYTQIRAPISGRIGKSSVTPGALVTAHQQDPLAVIQQTGHVYVDISQSSAEALRLRRALAEGRLAPGTASVGLTLEDGSAYAALPQAGEQVRKPLCGTLLFSEETVDQATGAVLLRAVFDNPDGLLLPGMFVTATIEEGVREGCVLAPQSSVLPDSEGGHFLYVLHGEGSGTFTAERRSVRLGGRAGSCWIVEEGLAPGELYVAEGLQKASDGAAVRGEPLASRQAK